METKLKLGDLISYAVLIGSMLVYYFTAHQATMQRVVVLETKAIRTEQDISEIKQDLKAVLGLLRQRR
ncbi:MAG: hypothetical protein HS115_11670 [Spirochaetales bacterium]|nr:hypothetical protein [Spirochaetales bacterium]